MVQRWGRSSTRWITESNACSYWLAELRNAPNAHAIGRFCPRLSPLLYKQHIAIFFSHSHHLRRRSNPCQFPSPNSSFLLPFLSTLCTFRSSASLSIMPLSNHAPSGVIRDRFAQIQREERREFQKARSLRRALQEHRERRSYRHEIKEQQKLLEEAIATEKRFNRRRRERQQRRHDPRAATDRFTSVHIKQVDLDQFFRLPTPSTRVEIDLTEDEGPAPEEQDFEFEPLPVPEPVQVPPQEEPVPAPVRAHASEDVNMFKFALIATSTAVFTCGFVTGAWTAIGFM